MCLILANQHNQDQHKKHQNCHVVKSSKRWLNKRWLVSSAETLIHRCWDKCTSYEGPESVIDSCVHQVLWTNNFATIDNQTSLIFDQRLLFVWSCKWRRSSAYVDNVADILMSETFAGRYDLVLLSIFLRGLLEVIPKFVSADLEQMKKFARVSAESSEKVHQISTQKNYKL